MIFFFDHDVPEDAAYSLEKMDHQVIRLREVLPTTTRDEDVLRYANDLVVHCFQCIGCIFGDIMVEEENHASVCI